MERFQQIVIYSFLPLIMFGKFSILDDSQVSEYAFFLTVSADKFLWTVNVIDTRT